MNCTHKEWDDNDFIMRTDIMDDDADVIVVLSGTNDFVHGDAELGDFSSKMNIFYGAMHIGCILKKWTRKRK